MAEMSMYCAGREAKHFRKYPKWEERVENLCKETEYKNGEEVEIERHELKDDDVLYLHDSYVVTDGIMKDEHVIFDQVTDEWKEFCHQVLDFEIPVYEPIEIKTADEVSAEKDEAAAGD